MEEYIGGILLQCTTGDTRVIAVHYGTELVDLIISTKFWTSLQNGCDSNGALYKGIRGDFGHIPCLSA